MRNKEQMGTAYTIKIGRLTMACLTIVVLANVALGQSEKKIAYGILIDNTGSLRTQFADEIGLGKAVVKQVLPHGPVSLFCFASQGVGRNAAVTPGTEWSQDERQVGFELDNLFVQGGPTVLLDAIDAMTEALNTRVDGHKDEFRDKVIVLITDGEDRASQVKKEALAQKLKASGITVYAIGLVTELKSGHRDTATDLLKMITKQTGGRAVFPKAKQHDANALVSELLAH
jgi:hypothetical protein